MLARACKPSLINLYLLGIYILSISKYLNTSIHLYYKKNRHHNKVLTWGVHREGDNEQRYISYVATSAEATGQCKNTGFQSVAGRQQNIARGPQKPKSQGRPGTGGAKVKKEPRPKVGVAGRGNVGGYQHAGALKWAFWGGDVQCKTSRKVRVGAVLCVRHRI